MRILSVFIFLLIITGCEKEQKEDAQCRELQSVFLSVDETRIKQAITEAIISLPSRTHTQENLEALSAALSNDCGVTAKVLCFRCISTLPEQSEIRVSVTDGINIMNKTIDISAASTTNQTMKFVAMHD
jgi:hypothetical protein